jgi:single-strand DNA-binding protein
MNQVFLRGNAANDPQLTNTPSGIAICTFTLVTNRKIHTKDGDKELAEWHNIRAWRKPAETIANMVRKGDSVFISGEIRTDNWEAQDGGKRYKTYIEVHEFTVQYKAENTQQEVQ